MCTMSVTRFNIKTTQNPANQLIAGFLFLGKTLKYAPILIKVVSDSVSSFEILYDSPNKL